MSNLNLNQVTSQSVFKLLKSSSEKLNSLNTGFNKGEMDTGFFHFIGYNPEEKTYLLTKPIDYENPYINTGIVMNEAYYKEHCICLLSFTLNNN